MAGSVNKTIIIGTLGCDPKMFNTANGQGCNLSLATNEHWTDSSGVKQEKTEWHRIVLFGRNAENAEKYLQKGNQVYIEGRGETTSYKKNGVTIYSHQIVGKIMSFV